MRTCCTKVCPYFKGWIWALFACSIVKRALPSSGLLSIVIKFRVGDRLSILVHRQVPPPVLRVLLRMVFILCQIAFMDFIFLDCALSFLYVLHGRILQFTSVVCAMEQVLTYFFRSTSKSRPNNIRGGKNVRPYVRPYVRPSVRPQKVSSISMKFGI